MYESVPLPPFNWQHSGHVGKSRSFTECSDEIIFKILRAAFTLRKISIVMSCLCCCSLRESIISQCRTSFEFDDLSSLFDSQRLVVVRHGFLQINSYFMFWRSLPDFWTMMLISSKVLRDPDRIAHVSMKIFIRLLNYTPYVIGAVLAASTNTLNPLLVENTSNSSNFENNSNPLPVENTSTPLTFENELKKQSSSFVELPEELVIKIAHYLDNPYSSFPFLCKTIWNLLNNNLSPQQILKSRTKCKNFDKIEKSIELHRLLKLHPILLNRLFKDYFVKSIRVFDIFLNNVILDYAFPESIHDNESDSYYKLKFHNCIRSLMTAKNYDCLEHLIKWALSNSPKVFNIDDGRNMKNWFRYLCETKNTLLKDLIKNVFLMEVIFSIILTTKITLDEFWGFFSAADIENDQQKSELILGPVCDIISWENVYFNSLSVDEKEYILTRNLQIIQVLPIDKNNWAYIKYKLVDYALNSKPEEFDYKAFIKKLYDSLDSIVNEIDRKIKFDELISNIANLAVHENRFDVIYAMEQIREERKNINLRTVFILRDIELLSDESLFYIYEHCIISAHMEFIRRIHSDFRTLEDLNMFSYLSDKFVALAKFYSIAMFRNQLSLIPRNIKEYNSIIRSIIYNLDNPAPFVHEIIVAATLNLSADSLSDLQLMFHKYITNLLEPQNAHIIKDLSIYPTFKISTLNKNLEFRKRFASPEAEELRSHFEIDFSSIYLLSHEIVAFFKLFGLEFGGFEIDPIRLEIDLTKYSVKSLKAASLEDLDNILVATAMKDFKKNFGADCLPILGGYFGAFQLWRERNLKNFNVYAPSDIIAYFNAE